MLDHVIPRELGGSNDASNLVTCCDECNPKRGTKTPPTFAHELAAKQYINAHNIADETLEILTRVYAALVAPLPVVKPFAPNERRKVTPA